MSIQLFWLTLHTGFPISSLTGWQGYPRKTIPIAVDNLIELEAAIANRIFNLIESVLRLGVLPTSRCYRPEIVAKHMAPILELNDIIAQPPTDTKETPND